MTWLCYNLTKGHVPPIVHLRMSAPHYKAR